MSYKKDMFTVKKNRRKVTLLSTMILFGSLAGCGSSDENGNLGYIQVYNASSNSPAIFLTVDKESDSSFDEKTHSSVSYTHASGYYEYDTDTYDIDLSWQDSSNSGDLDVFYESQLKVASDTLQFIMIAEDFNAPEVIIHNIPIIDDETDDDNDLFNLRFSNMHPWSNGIDIYLSKSEESFNEAVLFGQYSYAEMSENTKYEQDSYVFYITSAGSDEILYQSEEISFPYSSQYIMVIRENKGPGTSPFTLDKVSTSSTVIEYPDQDSEAEFRIYNGIIQHELLPQYNGNIDLHVDGIDELPEVTALNLGALSSTMVTDFGDYSLTLTMSENNETLIKNHLLTLSANSDKTVFFYLLEEEVDDDGDGNVDENGDGIVDQIDIKINSLVVNNSNRESLYEHYINVINLVDDYTYLDVYFVRSDETIDTADATLKTPYITPQTISLLNNTYRVYIIAKDDSSQLILANVELILDETSNDSFLIIEESIHSSTGFKTTMIKQKD